MLRTTLFQLNLKPNTKLSLGACNDLISMYRIDFFSLSVGYYKYLLNLNKSIFIYKIHIICILFLDYFQYLQLFFAAFSFLLRTSYFFLKNTFSRLIYDKSIWSTNNIEKIPPQFGYFYYIIFKFTYV